MAIQQFPMWEHMIVDLPTADYAHCMPQDRAAFRERDERAFDKQVGEAGDEGWEAVSMTDTKILFKRRVA